MLHLIISIDLWKLRVEKNTLHDTVGILFQNEPNEGTSETISQHLPSTSSQYTSKVITNIIDSINCTYLENKNKKIRTFEAITSEVTPYRKKPKMVGTFIKQ